MDVSPNTPVDTSSYVLTRVATSEVDSACALIFGLNEIVRTQVDFTLEAILFFIGGSKKEISSALLK